MVNTSVAYDYDQAVSAAFMQNHYGKVCIAFSDPVYVRSEAILVDRKTCTVHALIHESSYFLGQVSDIMVNAFLNNAAALLTALRPDGSIFELEAPVFDMARERV